MNGIGSDRKVAGAALVAAAAIFLVILVYAFSVQVTEDIVQLIIGLADVVAAAVCTVLCVILWRNFDRKELLHRVWLDLGIGLAMWTLAEVIYFLYGLILRQDVPNPSLADAVWLPGFVPVFAAFWLRYRSLRVSLSRKQMIGVVAAFVGLAALSMTFVIIPGLEDAESSMGEIIMGVLYAFGDLLMAMAVSLTIVALLGGQLSRSWMLVALGFLSIAVGDSLYYSGISAGWYTGEVPINLGSAVADISYMAGYVIIALGLYDQALLQRAV